MTAISGFSIVVCRDGKNISFGPVQISHLLATGKIETMETTMVGGAHAYRCRDYTVDELNAIVLSEKRLRECDFCSDTPAPWKINARPFTLSLGPNAGGTLGGTRPIFACAGCVPYVKKNDKRGLLEHAVDTHIERAFDQGAMRERALVPKAKDIIRPMIADVVFAMFRNRQGYPEEDS